VHVRNLFVSAWGTSFRYGEVGPNNICTSGQPDLVQIWAVGSTAPRDVTLEGSLVHDNNQNGCLSNGDHPDALQVYPAGGTSPNITIRGNRFWWCGTQCIFLGDGVFPNALIENNMVEETDACGNCGGSGEVNVDLPSSGIVRYNTIEGSTVAGSAQVYGNLFLTSPWSCGSASWSYNVFAPGGVSCGTNATKGVPILSNGSPYSGDRQADWHLSASDTVATNHGNPASYPALDLDGQARPMGGAPDAGADEAR